LAVQVHEAALYGDANFRYVMGEFPAQFVTINNIDMIM
jgi:hypothetical protein